MTSLGASPTPGVHVQMNNREREYPTGDGLCCPMCHRGTVIQQDCTRELGTCCSPCRSGTFMNNPSGLNACFPCTPCDTDTLHGLFALQNCTSTADTVCDVLSGYLCKSLANNKGCMMAEEHSQCAPGQGIKQLGTSRTDNVCEDYFSQDVVACKLCSETQVKVKEGGASTDIVCSDGSRNHSMVCYEPKQDKRPLKDDDTQNETLLAQASDFTEAETIYILLDFGNMWMRYP
ncbi:tumor necrosis factor receptor superfamily member 14-like [Echeneis naucrates]|uniref:tumor necrosis factor receptor superfamily member 14-like n=1 Tax=Echeneis naucrates TaxID=173247 RepID=UPI0011143F35|nr:tumor necrosis factor receptor superfamily member 14-like [Echeneis naucrates]